MSGGGLQLFLDLFSKDDIHIWTGAHDLEMAGQFRGGMQLFLPISGGLQLCLGLFSNDDSHSWAGAHDYFRGVCSYS